MRSDLGTALGASRHDIDVSFKESVYSSHPTCLACGQTAGYRLVAKHAGVNSQAVVSEGFVCEYHLTIQPAFDPKDFGIRKLT